MFKYNLFLLTNLPSAWFSGVRVRSVNEDKCIVDVKLKWFNQNPFKSMFWAVQGMAAELSTGIPIIHEVNNRKIRVSMLVTSNSSKFYKKAVGRIKHGIQNKLTLGNLDASRDWGFAGDYTEAMWKMLKHDTADDWVIATGETHTVKEFLEAAFKCVDLNWEDYVQTSEIYFRPNEVNYLLGDPSKAKKELDWKPNVSFNDLVTMMVENDLHEAEKEYTLLRDGLIKPTWENPANI